MTDIQPHYPTITAALAHHALHRPDAVAFEFMSPHSERVIQTFGELFDQSQRVATWLRRAVKPGSRILLPSNNDRTFHPAFMGCLMAGCIAIPIQIPIPKAKPKDKGLGRFNAILQDSDAALMLLDERNLNALVRHLSGTAAHFSQNLPMQGIEEILQNTTSDGAEDVAHPDGVAFLQYTSGSTAAPRGVVIRNHAIVCNQRDVQYRYGLTEYTDTVSWLPLYHDMGLCTGLLQPIYLGQTGVLTTPQDFITRPYIWLREISTHHHVFSAAPNFAFSHCARRIPDEDLATLDLSSWHAAVCGAEPIIADDIEAFFQRFSSVGFRPTAFCPSYGMAECTLMITGLHPGNTTNFGRFAAPALGEHRVETTTDTTDSIRLVGCGVTGVGTRVRIVDPATHEDTPQGEVGEIAVASESEGDGYWNNTKATEATFGYDLEHNGHSRYVLSGDLGFIHEGELFICGRRKDLIIVNGVNHYPQDIERTAQLQHPDLPLYRAAAFHSRFGESDVVLVVEAPRRVVLDEAETLRQDIIQAVRLEHQLTLSDVVIVNVGSVPKTSSGKVQRQQSAQLYREGQFQPPRRRLQPQTQAEAGSPA